MVEVQPHACPLPRPPTQRCISSLALMGGAARDSGMQRKLPEWIQHISNNYEIGSCDTDSSFIIP